MPKGGYKGDQANIHKGGFGEKAFNLKIR